PNPLLMDLDTSTTIWKVLYPTTAPYTTNPGTGFTHPCAADTAFTGLITDASGPATNPAINGFALDAGTYRNHYNLVGTTWSRGNLVLNSSCGASPPYPAYYGAAKIGPNAIVFGDLDPGSPACPGSPAQRIPPFNKVPANVFIYDQF